MLGENLAIGGVEFIATLGAGKLAVQGGKSGLALSERIVSRFGGADVSSFGYSTLDAMEATGRLGGQIYDSRKLQQFGDYLQRRGIALKVGDEFVPLGKAGGFDAVEGELRLLNNPTNYEVWHEMSHFKQSRNLGLDLYNAQDRVQKEQFVFDLLENSPKRRNSLNFDEQQHAIDYIDRVGGFR